MATTDIKQIIQESAAAPRRIANDAGETEEQPLRDLVEADRYVRSADALSKTSSPFRRLRFSKIRFGRDA